LWFLDKSCSEIIAASGLTPGTIIENDSGLRGVFGLKVDIIV
jgi:hypothetical protein